VGKASSLSMAPAAESHRQGRGALLAPLRRQPVRWPTVDALGGMHSANDNGGRRAWLAEGGGSGGRGLVVAGGGRL
jgi:hypothetical protein